MSPTASPEYLSFVAARDRNDALRLLRADLFAHPNLNTVSVTLAPGADFQGMALKRLLHARICYLVGLFTEEC